MLTIYAAFLLAGASPADSLVVSATWLAAHRSDSGLVVLQAERSRAPFDSAHVAGARFVALGDYTVKRGDVLTELPSLEQLDELFEGLGIGERGRIVLYGDILPVTRLFFTLDYAGLGDRVSVLAGGLAAWTAAGGPVTALPTPAPARGTLTLHPQATALADVKWVESHLADSTVTLLDARTRGEFDGSVLEDGVARAGHIPGAKHLDWTTTITHGSFREPAELRRLLSDAGVAPGRELVTYCRVGTRASALYFVARLLGYRVRLYDGSMNEWAAHAELPVSRGVPE